MDILVWSMRLLHIIFGSFWAGTVFFTVLILEPRLRRMGPQFSGPVMGTLMQVVVPAMISSGLIVIASGFVLTYQLWGGVVGLSGSAAGRALLTGIVTSIGAAVIGTTILTPTGIRLGRLAKSLDGRQPDEKEAKELKRLSTRMEWFTRLNFTLILIALVTMSVMRYM